MPSSMSRSMASLSLVPTPSVPGAGNHQRVAIAMQRQFEQTTEAANAADAAFAPGRFDRRLDSFHQFITGVDVDARVQITQGCFGIHALLVQEIIVVCYFTRLAGKCPSIEQVD